MRLAGRVAYVTGGGHGIGRGIALSLAREGAQVMVADIDGAAACEVAKEVSVIGPRGRGLTVDVRRWEDVQGLCNGVIEEFGRLDIAVNSAGVISVHRVEELAEAEWDRVMDVNAKGTFLCCKASVPLLKRAGGGRIINISSISGKDGYPGLAHYSASKFAIIGLTNSLAKELASDEITVNAICPGVVKTSMWDFLSESWRREDESAEQSWARQILAFVPQGRPQTVDDVGALAVYLALAPSLTGQAINLDGGLTSH